MSSAEQVARAMWAAIPANPNLPPPLPFDELDNSYKRILLCMAQAAVVEVAGTNP